MREKIQRWHNDVIETYQHIMFETLVYPNNILSKKTQVFTFEQESPEMQGEDRWQQVEPLRGYLASKEIGERVVTYFIDEEFLSVLPIRVNKYDEYYLKESTSKRLIIFRPTNPTKFNIIPEKQFSSDKEFIDYIADFRHSRPDMWTLTKMIAVMGYVGKTFIGLCSPSEYGKSGMFKLIHGMTGKSIVFRPRSPAGVLIQFNEDGNMVFDEIQKCKQDTIDIIEEIAQLVGDGSPYYINGAVKAKYLKQKYSAVDQSLTFLFNVITNYANESDFFENVWKNPVGLDTKFLKLKVEGEMLEKFDKAFDVRKCAEDNKMEYIKIAKHLLYLKQSKAKNAYKRRYDYHSGMMLNNRRESIYNEITWMIDRYSNTLEEYKGWIYLLDSCILSYKEMVGKEAGYHKIEEKQEHIVEEVISPIDFIKERGGECLTDDFCEKFSDKEMQKLLKEGEIYENSPKTIRILE